MNWFDWVSDSIKDPRFLAVLGVVFLVVILVRLPSQPLRLPEAAHNTVGDLPVFEQADDGYVSSIGEKPPVEKEIIKIVEVPVYVPTVYNQRQRGTYGATSTFFSFGPTVTSSSAFRFQGSDNLDSLGSN